MAVCILFLTAAASAGLYFAFRNFLVLLILVININTLLFLLLGKGALGHVIFPYGKKVFKDDYRWRMNAKMVYDVRRSFKKAADYIEDLCYKDNFKICQSLREYKTQANAIKKVCEFVELFAKVNRYLVDNDASKKLRGKSTRRADITAQFIQLTEDFETIKAVLSELKIRSVSELLHDDGNELPYEMQERVNDPSQLRSFYYHFMELNDVKRQEKDLREYRTLDNSKQLMFDGL